MAANREILIMSSPPLTFLLPVMLAALDKHWPGHWPARCCVSKPALNFPENLRAALKRSPPITLLVMSDHLPLRCTAGDIAFAEAAVSADKCCAAICTKIPEHNPRAKLFFGGTNGWQECSASDPCRISLHPTLWRTEVLCKIADRFKGAGISSPWDFELKASAQFASLSVWRALTASPFETLHGGFVKKGVLLPSFVPYINSGYTAVGGS